MDENNFIKILFDPDDHYCTGNARATTVSKVENNPKYEFYTINPIDGNRDHEKGLNIGRRCDLNVTKFRNFVFEFDTLSIAQQKQLIDSLPIKSSMQVHSGNKSIHLVFSLETPLHLEPHKIDSINEYKLIWKKIAHMINTKSNELFSILNATDPSCKNPSRLTRYPGATRSNGKQQKLLHLGKRVNNDLLFAWIKDVNIKSYNNYTIQEIEEFKPFTELEFEKKCNEALLRYIKYPTWASDANMYPVLYKLTLWAIDDCQINLDSLLSYYEKHTFPFLLKQNYPEEKLHIPIYHAYKQKGGL